MIQAVMYFAMGLLTASLIVLVVTPAIWRRAMRLTKARIESSVPMSLSEIQADKDQLRAEFAMSNRRLEMNVDRLREKVAEQVVDINRKRDEVAALTAAQTARVVAVTEMEARVTAMAAAVKAADERIAAANAELAVRDNRIAEQTKSLATLRGDLTASMQLTEEQQLELVARNTEIGNLSDEVADARATTERITHARDALAAELAEENQRLADERRRVEGLQASLTVLNAERTERLAELDRRIAEFKVLEATIASERDERKTLAEQIARFEAERSGMRAEIEHRTEEVKALNAELFADVARREALEARIAEADKALADARSEAATLKQRIERDEIAEGDNLRKAIAATEAEKEALARRLVALEDEYSELRDENEELRRLTGAEWEADRQENERLRARLSEIASGVVRLTQAAGHAPLYSGDGNGNSAHQAPISREAPSLDPSAAVENGEPVEAPSLAERIRALQHAGARH